MAEEKKEIGTGFITEVDRYLFNNGKHYEIYEKLGAHPRYGRPTQSKSEWLVISTAGIRMKIQ